MSDIEILGFVAVGLMMVTYALEHRDPRYVLAFAAACVLAAGYAVAIGSWPFAVVEAVWSLVALRRWSQRRPSNEPIACRLDALTPEERSERATIASRLQQLVAGSGGLAVTPSGLLVQLPDDPATLAEAGRLIGFERKCCPFLEFDLHLSPKAEGSTLEIRGPRGTGRFLEHELGLGPDASQPGERTGSCC